MVAFGFLHSHGSPGWGCNLLEDWCCWVLEVGDVGQCKPWKRIKLKFIEIPTYVFYSIAACIIWCFSVITQDQPLLSVKQVSWLFQAQRSSCLKVHVKVIWACSVAPAWGRLSARLSGYSVQCLVGCTNNMGAVAASVLRPHGRLG